MSSQKILVPYNFTVYDQKALYFVIQTFAHLKDVEITLFNAYTPAPEIDMRGSPIMETMKSHIHFLSSKIKEQEDGLKAAKQNLLENGFQKHRVKYIFKPRKKDIATEIISLAENDNFDLIVLNHTPGSLTHFFTAHVFNKIVSALKDKTICVVT